MTLIDINYSLSKENRSFFGELDSKFKVEIIWSKNYINDYCRLGDNYFKCAFKICNEIVKSGHNNIKSDMWFLPSVYMFRQSIELGLKALVCRTAESKAKIQETFLECKHNLFKLFEFYLESSERYLNASEEKWLKDYLYDLERIDEKSDLFRFPFEDKFLMKYKNKFLDIPAIADNCTQCYSLIRKCIERGNLNIKLKESRVPKFLLFAGHGIGNCHLWDSDDNFHRQDIGYSKAAEFLFFKCDEISNEEKAYPLIFLLRNLLELALKRMFNKNIDYGVKQHIFMRKRKSHLLYKDLWRNIRPTIEYYSNEEISRLSIINIIERQLIELSKIDKNGDIFRYPTSYSLEYRFNNQVLDLKNVYLYMQSIYRFLDDFDSMFSMLEEYQVEMSNHLNL